MYSHIPCNVEFAQSRITQPSRRMAGHDWMLPGYNVDEWIVLDKLFRPGVPMVMLNGGLDKVC